MLTRCRLCGYTHMTPFLDLGFTPPADRFMTARQLDEPEIHYPLKVVRCDQCLLVQLNYVVPPAILYQEDYPYESSTTATGRKHFDDFAAAAITAFDVKPGDLAVDIGSNVGVLLSGFKQRGCRVLGIDPAANIADIAIKKGIPTEAVFFNAQVARNVAATHGKASVITATNVFAHVDDVLDFMQGIDALLADKGVLIIEAPYLVHLLESLEYDTIYHEHLSYLSLTPLVPFFHHCGFELFNVEQMDIHGGSNRMFVARKGQYPVSEKTRDLLAYETAHNIHSLEYLQAFAQRVQKNREDLCALLRKLKSEGKRIAAVSAPAKGMTLLNYCRIDAGLLEFVTEKSTLKIDRFAPGSHLPVKTDAALLSENIDYALLLAWNFKEEIMRNLAAFRAKGGKFIIPIPEPVIVE